MSTDTKLRDIESIKNAIRDIPDFPKPGIVFKDISTLTSNPEAFKLVTDLFYEQLKDLKIDYLVALESRGFIFAGPLAQKLNAGITLVRKPGKLPGKTVSHSYELEYGSDTIEIHEDAFDNAVKNSSSGKKVLIIDDLLATGGTAAAAAELIQKVGGELVGAAFVVELDFLNGREKLPEATEIYSLVHY